jgi:hypothetical protein
MASCAPWPLDAYAPLYVPMLPMTYGVPVALLAVLLGDVPVLAVLAALAALAALDEPAAAVLLDGLLHAAATKTTTAAPNAAATLRCFALVIMNAPLRGVYFVFSDRSVSSGGVSATSSLLR